MTIRIRMDAVNQLTDSLGRQFPEITNAKNGFSTLRYNVDSSILARRNIGTRMNAVVQSLNTLEMQLRALESFVHQSMEKYDNVENAILHRAQTIRGNVSFYAMDIRNRGLQVQDAYLGYLASGMPILSYLLKEDRLKAMKDAWNLSFITYKKNGITYIKILKGKEKTSDLLKAKLKQYVNNDAKWNKDLADKLANKGIGLGQWEEEGFRDFKKSRLFSESNMPGMGQYINRIGESKLKVFSEEFSTSFKNNINVFDDFKGWKGVSTMSKFGKSAGSLGTVLTIFDIAKNDLYDQKSGKMDYSFDNSKKFIVDSAVGLSSSAAAIATGAAIGSLIVPPLGTVVGIGAGIAVNWAINAECFNGKSLVEWSGIGANKLVDYASEGIDRGIEKLKDMSKQAAKELGEVVNDAERAVKEIFNDAVDQVDDVLNTIGSRLGHLF